FYEEHQWKTPFKNVTKIDEIPFDFSRRRLTVVVNADDHQLMITKGAVEEMEEVCTHAQINGEIVPLSTAVREELRRVNVQMNKQGMRVLAVAVKKDVHKEAVYSVEDEKEMTLIGFMGFLDPAKESAVSAIRSLHEHGVNVKVLTGDNDIVAKKVCKDVGIEVSHVLLGSQIEAMTDEELRAQVEETNLFAKLNPMQKSKIIELLQAKGHTVGFMGDGINDAPALRKADVGISVDTAADITKDASSIILLEKSLNVLESGVIEGRKVFSNMMKYIKITISSNFGNVFSILVASAFLPFLPMLSLQLLIQNLIYDVAQLTIPWDNVDEEELLSPVRWETNGLAKFTVCIGPVSSIFDILTYLVMWFVFSANSLATQHLFQTGWFIESMWSQTMVIHMLRSPKLPFIQSHPALSVVVTTLFAAFFVTSLPYSPLASLLKLSHLNGLYFILLFIIITLYMLSVTFVKHIYIKKYKEWL
ncbi:MAG: magnesium-translocating P-type ATPase, partial [Enterococcus faecalis]|nr:magnesium-translocating P-type ATPase [Enterococcus faecalis]